MQKFAETIIVKINKIVYQNESKWTIALTDKGTIKGVINFDASESDMLKLDGIWVHSDFDGKNEFKFHSAMLHLPEDARALLSYAVSITKGLGETKEIAIWEKYGAKWQDEKTLDIRGVTETIQFHWADTLRKIKEHGEQTQAISFLLSHGCTMNLACAAWEKWEFDTLGNVSENPYALCDVPRYGFAWIDENVRPHFGIEDDDERRIDACIIYVMGLLAAKHGTALLTDQIVGSVKELILCNPMERVKSIADLGLIVLVSARHYALADDYKNELAIWERWKI